MVVILSGCASMNLGNKRDAITIKSDNLNEYKITLDDKRANITTNSNGMNFNVIRKKIFAKKESTNSLSKEGTTNPNMKEIGVRLVNFKAKGTTLLLSHPNYDTITINVKRTVRMDALAKDVGLGLFTFGIALVIAIFQINFIFIPLPVIYSYEK